MKIRNALSIGAETLSRSDSAELDARLLLEQVLAVSHSYLLAHASDTLSNTHITHYFALLARAEQGEPIPYILGSQPFRHAEIAVSPAVLIPRPETEQLVDHVIQWAKQHSVKRIVDVGTGSGCIAISLAQELANVAVTGVDISAEALQVARQNGITNQVTIDWQHGSLLNTTNGPFDIIVANLPYVAENERDLLGDSVLAFEPALALFGGPDGLDLVRELLQQATEKLAPIGAIFLEIGFQQGAATVELAQSYFPTASVICHADYAGNDRFVTVSR